MIQLCSFKIGIIEERSFGIPVILLQLQSLIVPIHLFHSISLEWCDNSNHSSISLLHDEGRLVQVNGTWQSEYVIKDHLGNARVTFRDVDGNPFKKWFNTGDGGDSYRTASVNMKWGDWEGGFNIFTGYRDMSESLRGPTSPGFPYGKVSNPEVHKYWAGIAYIGYKGYRVGWNAENIRHAIQNKMAHTWLTQQRSIEPMLFPERFYGGYGKGSRYHNW